MSDTANLEDFRKESSFKNEKEFQKYLVLNADYWITDFFGGPGTLEEQHYFGLKYFGSNKPRIDLVIKMEDGSKIGVEVKNPIQCFAELSRSVSQILANAILEEDFSSEFDQLALITSRFDPIVIKIIKKFELPIRLFVVNKDVHCEIK